MSDAAHWRKRAALLHYIQTVHEGRMRWLNVSSLKWNDLVSLASKSLRKKLELWYLLGISLDSILAAPTCARLVALLAQLVEEADFITSGSVQQAVTLALAKDMRQHDYCEAEDEVDHDGGKATLRKHGKHLLLKIIPPNWTPPPGLSFRAVVIALCELLIPIYSRVAVECGALPPHAQDMFQKADKYLKKNFFGWVAKLLAEHSELSLKDALSSPDSVLDAWAALPPCSPAHPPALLLSSADAQPPVAAARRPSAFEA